MYLPRSAALLGSRATCNEKRDLGQETVPAPLQAGGALRSCGLRFTACPGSFPLIQARRSQKGWRDPPSKPRGLPVNTACLRSLGCLVGDPGSAPVCLNITELTNIVINAVDLLQAFSLLSSLCIKYLRNYYTPGTVLGSKATTETKAWSCSERSQPWEPGKHGSQATCRLSWLGNSDCDGFKTWPQMSGHSSL